ncbi:hypothetical protein ALC56_14181, partial [Trachymyrmex septentrionalis]
LQRVFLSYMCILYKSIIFLSKSQRRKFYICSCYCARHFCPPNFDSVYAGKVAGLLDGILVRKQSSLESKAPSGHIRGALGVILPTYLRTYLYFTGIYPIFAKLAWRNVNFKINELYYYRHLYNSSETTFRLEGRVKPMGVTAEGKRETKRFNKE